MFVQVKNENYGYTVATYGDYVVVSNPALTRWTLASASVFHTGSVDFFRYNKSTDQHDYVTTVYKYPIEIDVILTTEPTGSPAAPLDIQTETAINLLIDKDLYTASVDNGFGIALDMYGKLLVVGSPYYTQIVTTTSSLISASGGSIDIFDLAQTEFVSTTQNSYVTTIEDPDSLDVTSSFGQAVSINYDWLAVGSPYVSSSNGMVYMYRNISTGSSYSWSLAQKIEASGAIAGAMFGWSLKLNKEPGAMSHSMVVGCGNLSSNEAYYFEYVSGSWAQTYVFAPTVDIHPLTFGNYTPYLPTMNSDSGYGYAVSTYGDAVIIGAHQDRMVYEFSGSTQYEQGAVYVYEKCSNVPYTVFNLVLKTYGSSSILKNNRLGYSVDIFERNAVAGSPKINTMNSCYIGGTLEQFHQCESDLENTLHGQSVLLQKNTSSFEWDITNVYQRKKKYLMPYRKYGYDVAIADRSMVVGAPMLLSDDNRQINVSTTQSQGISLDDLSGKAYIYNLANLRYEFHIGNVFYRNGKIVVMTSGSIFDGLFLNSFNTKFYEYNLQFKGQHTIFEKQVVCSVSPGEFNVSTNPTAIEISSGSFDVNANGIFDFQDVDVLLRYMQYKNTSLLGVTVSTDWSSSVVKTDDEISLLNYYLNQSNYSAVQTSTLTSESIIRWEQTDTGMQNLLDFNEDNKIDVRDMNIMWKYFSNRLTQGNYSTYITPSSNRKLFSDVMDYLNVQSKKTAIPYIKSMFLDYEAQAAVDKTGSFATPYVTTIGLYSGLDLIGVAKLGSPIKITPELPMNFVVKMDF